MWGSTLNQLGILIKQVLNRIRKSGLKQNKDKCVFGATKLIFLGHKISGKEISPDLEKLGESKTCLFQNLSKIAYLSKFISHLSERTCLLGELVKKNSTWELIVTIETNLIN